MVQMTAQEFIAETNQMADSQRAKNSAWFFKANDGGYGAGDKFIGVRVPLIRQVCKRYQQLSLPEIEKLLDSPTHEHRLAAVIIMTIQARRASAADKKSLYDLYLRRHDRINNWDLVDTGCRDVIGAWLEDKLRQPLYKLARSKDLWERRTAIVSTSQFIAHDDLGDTFAISELLLRDNEDLIHKAVGWMLREAGKRDELALKRFLDKHAATMPRTALRYSLEKLAPKDRAYYMSLKRSVVK